MMVNKNIFVVLLSTFCLLQSAEYGNNSIHAIDIRKRLEKVQMVRNSDPYQSRLMFDLGGIPEPEMRKLQEEAARLGRGKKDVTCMIMMGAMIAVTLDTVNQENERSQIELEQDRARIFKNQKNRHNQNQNTNQQMSTKKQKKYNNGKHRNNSGR